MASKLLVASFAGLVVLMMLAQLSQADVKQKTYLIKGHKVESVVSAASQLRNFLSVNLNAHQRCQRHAILLNAYQLKKSTLTNFQIAEIGMLKREEVESRFNAIDIETLRNLYIDGIQKFLEARVANNALVELYKCLNAGFRNRDAKARSFLNNEEIKKIVSQYESVAEQPVKLLIEEDAKHPELRLEDLHPTVKDSLTKWFQGDESKLGTLFNTNQPRRPAPANHNQHAPQGHPEHGAPVEQHGGAYAEAHAEAAGAVPEPADEQEEVMNYLGYVFGSIIATYDSLPLETSLSERCRAYSRVVEAEKEDLFKETYVNELVQHVTENLSRAKAESFVPDQTKRENFLFVVQTVDPLQGGGEAWSDMVDCVRQWVDVDEEAAAFMHSPGLAQIFDQLLAQSNPEAIPPAEFEGLPEEEAALLAGQLPPEEYGEAVAAQEHRSVA